MYIRGFAIPPSTVNGEGSADHKNQAVNLHKKEGSTVQRKKTFLVVRFSILTVVARSQVAGGVPVEKIIPGHLDFARIPLFPGPSTPAALLTGLRPAAARPLPPFHVTGREAYQP